MARSTDLRNEEKAEAFLHGWGLERGKFLCCIPRYRITPYWTIHKERAFDPVKQKRNDAMKEHDHAQLRGPLKEQVAAGNGNQGMWLGVRGEQQAQVGTYAGRFAGCQRETLGFHCAAWLAPGSLISTYASSRI